MILINTLQLDQIATALPWWLYVLMALYAIGAALAAKAVNPNKKWWQKVLFVILWPLFLLRIMVSLALIFKT